jgi:hypothetical protein
MKKNILRAAFVVAFGLAVGYTTYSSQKDEHALSDVVLDNVEALASGESSNECTGCDFISLNICRIYGDWGACIGEKVYYI